MAFSGIGLPSGIVKRKSSGMLYVSTKDSEGQRLRVSAKTKNLSDALELKAYLEENTPSRTYSEVVIDLKCGRKYSVGSSARFSPLRVFSSSQKRRIDGLNLVYFIGPRNGVGIKIGRTNSIQSRLSSLNCGHPQDLFVWAAILSDNDKIVEGYMHEALGDYNINREWFERDAAFLAISCLEEVKCPGLVLGRRQIVEDKRIKQSCQRVNDIFYMGQSLKPR